MKFVIVLSLFIVASQATPAPVLDFLKPGEVTADTYEEFNSGFEIGGDSRIAAGTNAKKGDYPELCYLTIGFFNKMQNCGCWIYAQQYVVTSARCVVDCSEGNAANVTVTISSLTGKDAVYKIEKLYIPDGTNGNAALDQYMGDGVPDFHTITGNNVALIKLITAIPTTKYSIKYAYKAKLGNDADIDAFYLRMKNFKIRACGVGVIGNNGERSRYIQCAAMNIITDGASCTDDAGNQITLLDGQVCLKWTDRANNACVGDFGGPVYAYNLNDKKAIDISTQEVVCTLVGSPNVRTGTPCLDGHVTICTLMSGPIATDSKNAQAWLNFILNPTA